jgi:1-deoxyxylulose-5-phosphate synthase
MECVDFGQTGLRVSRLSFGTGSNSEPTYSEQTKLGFDGLVNLLRAAYDCGVTFWDSAQQYGSHPHVARAMRGIPRDSVVISTKTHSIDGKQVTKEIEQFLQELGTDVLDMVLLHGIRRPDWPAHRAGAMEALSRAQEQGKVRAVGVSCHSLEALRATVETDWAEVALVRINHAGINMDASPEIVVPLLDQLYAAGKAVYAMKVLGCGPLADDVRAAIRYVLQLGTVHALTIGISDPAHLQEHVRIIDELAPQFPLR